MVLSLSLARNLAHPFENLCAEPLNYEVASKVEEYRELRLTHSDSLNFEKSIKETNTYKQCQKFFLNLKTMLGLAHCFLKSSI